MDQQLHRVRLADGVYFSSIQDPKFKHNGISINLVTPLAEDTATANALLSGLLRRGSRSCPDFTKLEQTLCELYGASLSTDVGKFGGQQVLIYSIAGIDDRFALEEESISVGCAKLLWDIVFDPNITDGAFPEKDLLLERQNLIDAIQAEINEKRTYTLNRCKALMFEGTRLAIPRYGWVEKAETLTAQETAQRYYDLIDTARVEIVFVGSGSPDGVREEFARRFGAMDRHPLAFTDDPVVEFADKVKEQTVEMEIAQSKMAMGFRIGNVSSQERVNAFRLMVSLYGGTPFSRLFVHVREEKSLCYYCAARYDRISGVMMVDIGVERENMEAARAAILEQLRAVTEGEFTDEELNSARLSYLNSLHSVPDSIANLEGWYMNQILCGTENSPEDEARAMERVTREQVIAAARQVTLDTVFFLAAKSGENGEEEENADE